MALEGKSTTDTLHTMKTHGRQLHSFLTLALETGEGLVLCSAHLNPSIHQIRGWVDPKASLDITQE